MVKTRSQRAKAASLPSNNDDRQSSEEQETQSSDEEDLASKQFWSSSYCIRIKLHFPERLAEEKEDPNSTHHPHAVRLTLKKPDDSPSHHLSSTPSPQSNSATHSQVQDVVELARKCTGEFLTLPEPKSSKPVTEDNNTVGWRINMVAVRQDPPSRVVLPKSSEQQNNKRKQRKGNDFLDHVVCINYLAPALVLQHTSNATRIKVNSAIE